MKADSVFPIWYKRHSKLFSQSTKNLERSLHLKCSLLPQITHALSPPGPNARWGCTTGGTSVVSTKLVLPEVSVGVPLLWGPSSKDSVLGGLFCIKSPNCCHFTACPLCRCFCDCCCFCCCCCGGMPLCMLCSPRESMRQFMLESERPCVFPGALLEGPVALRIDFVAPSTVIRIVLSPPWVGRVVNPGGGRERVLDWFAAFSPGLASDETFFSTALYDFVLTGCFCSLLVSDEVPTFFGSVISEVKGTLLTGSFTGFDNSSPRNSDEYRLSGLLTYFRVTGRLYGVPSWSTCSGGRLIFLVGEVFCNPLSWLSSIISCCNSWFSLFISMLCPAELLDDGDFGAFGLTSCMTSADDARLMSVVGLGPSKDN